MKKTNKIKLIVTLLLVFTLTGCTTVLKNSEGKIVKNPVTGQNITENILCQPTDEATIKIYEENNININQYPKCSELKLADKYEGLWVNIFVKPLAWLLIKIGLLVKSYGLSIILVTLLLRLIMYPITKKTAMQSEVMKEAKPELDKLEKKYSNKQDKDSMMQKSQEMMLIYKKYNISPVAGCIFGLIQLPLFLAFLEAINRLPALFEEKFIGFQLGTTTMTALSNGHYYYLIMNVILVLVTYISFKQMKRDTVSSNKEQDSTMYMMSNISVIMISIVSFTTPIGIGLYWIFNSSFTVLQNLLVKRGKKDVRKS